VRIQESWFGNGTLLRNVVRRAGTIVSGRKPGMAYGRV
jgi:hypothetical protein